MADNNNDNNNNVSKTAAATPTRAAVDQIPVALEGAVVVLGMQVSQDGSHFSTGAGRQLIQLHTYTCTHARA